jgi:hypothetical protein
MALACEGFAFTLLVALVFIYDRPFKANTTLSPKPIINAIAEMQNRASIRRQGRRLAPGRPEIWVAS